MNSCSKGFKRSIKRLNQNNQFFGNESFNCSLEHRNSGMFRGKYITGIGILYLYWSRLNCLSFAHSDEVWRFTIKLQCSERTFHVVVFFYTFLQDQNTVLPDQNINMEPIMLSLFPNVFRKNDFLTQPHRHRNAANSRNLSGFSKNGVYQYIFHPLCEFFGYFANRYCKALLYQQKFTKKLESLLLWLDVKLQKEQPNGITWR